MTRTAALPDWTRGQDAREGDRVAFGALLAFTVILTLAPQSFLPALAPLRIALLSALVALASYAIPRLLMNRPLSVNVPEIRLGALLGAWAFVTIPFGLWPGGSFAVFSGNFLKTLVISWLLCNVVTTVTRLRRVFVLLTLVAVPLAATAFHQYTSGTFLKGGPADAAARIKGYEAPLTSNPNDLALMLNVILPITVALATSPRPPFPRIVLATIAAASVAGVVLTFSRAGFLTLAAIIVLWMVRLKGRVFLEVALVAAAACLALLPLLPSGYTKQLSTITNTEADATGSAGERMRDMAAAGKYTMGHPIVGAGLGNSTLALNEVRGTTWRKVHNVYLELAVELGLPGAILFVFLLRAAIKSARQARELSRRPGGDPETAALSDGIVISLWGFVIASIFHPVSYHLYFYYLAALAVAAYGIARRALPEEVHA
ncbi:MAG TPA: O-antigen ligase family protein [Candidatus Polarisedimenticolaceae bacterium]|nr:O-antigen ligase family protein [Candidatus Polarisedimenticolaceae bacterium]